MKKTIIILLMLTGVVGISQKRNKQSADKEAEENAILLAEVDKRLSMAETTFEQYRQENSEQNKMSKEMALSGTSSVPNTAFIKPLLVKITHDVTVTIIFPAKIKTIDRGVDLIQSKKVDGVENVLKIKAEKPFDRPSNLTVITEDGEIYVYTIVYEVFTTDYAIDMNKIDEVGNNGVKAVPGPDENSGTNKIKFDGSGINSEEIAQLSTKILSEDNRVIDRKKEANINLIIKRLFVKDDIIFIPVQIINQGDLNYDIELVKFFSEDKKEMKRTVKQVMEIEPVYVFNETEVVKKKSAMTQVFAFDKFTINSDKIFRIVLYEKNGGRNVTCQLRYQDINRARFIK